MADTLAVLEAPHAGTRRMHEPFHVDDPNVHKRALCASPGTA
jgi:meiotically up-regulated gene 157 (Mug157) protein